MSDIPRITDKAEAEKWLDGVDERVKQLMGELPSDVSDRLDYSIDSLDVLEAYLLEKYEALNDVRNSDTEWAYVDRCGTYVGETMRKIIGGEWFIDTAKSDKVHMGVPGIKDHNGEDSDPIHPITWVTVSIDRRVGDFMSDYMNDLKE